MTKNSNHTAPRQRLADSLDKVFAKPLNPKHLLDVAECKLFGIGSESYVVGSRTETTAGNLLVNQNNFSYLSTAAAIFVVSL